MFGYRRHVFTLTELLIVIAVLAILVALLLPVLDRARESARRVLCLSNERNLAVAWFNFATDNNGYMVGPNEERGSNGLVDLPPPEGVHDWVYAPLDPSGDWTDAPYKEEDYLRGIRMGALFPHVNDVRVYACPNDRPAHSAMQNRDRLALRSYALTCNMRGGSQANGGTGGSCQSPFTRVGQVWQADGTHLFVEENTDPQGWNWGAWTPIGDPIATRHGGNIVTYVDGHGEVHKWQSTWLLVMQEDFGYWPMCWAPGYSPADQDVRWLNLAHTHRNRTTAVGGTFSDL